jgi:hypothetical protein
MLLYAYHQVRSANSKGVFYHVHGENDFENISLAVVDWNRLGVIFK